MRERLQQIIQKLKISRKDFATAIGFSPASISDYLNGRLKSISTDAVVAIYQKFQVNPAWLLTGRGEMFLSADKGGGQEGSRRDRIIAALPPEEEQAINDFIEYRASRSGVDISLIKEAGEEYTSEVGVVKVPLLGRIAAGVPIWAEENAEEVLEIPERWLPSSGSFFCLRVRGVSMAGAGIIDGDLAVLSSVSSPLEETRSGDIVAALINGEATLKRILFEGGRVVLVPENPRFSPIVLKEEDAVLIQGKLVLLLREYGDED